MTVTLYSPEPGSVAPRTTRQGVYRALHGIRQPQAVRRLIGLSGQSAAVDPFLTGAENLVMIGRLYGLSGRTARRRTAAQADQLGLADAAGRLVRAYSGGYLARDGLAGEEGGHVPAVHVHARARAGAGRSVEAATVTFQHAVAAINDVCLPADEVGPRSGEMIGNCPQAFGHIGLINDAWAMSQAQQHPGRA